MTYYKNRDLAEYQLSELIRLYDHLNWLNDKQMSAIGLLETNYGSESLVNDLSTMIDSTTSAIRKLESEIEDNTDYFIG